MVYLLNKIFNWFIKRFEKSVKEYEAHHNSESERTEPNYRKKSDSFDSAKLNFRTNDSIHSAGLPYNNQQYYWKMPIEVRAKFQYNYIIQKGGSAYFMEYIQDPFHYTPTFFDFIHQSFNWTTTPEGADYWYDIARMIYPNESIKIKRFNNSIVNSIIVTDCSNKNVKNLILTNDENR